MTGTPASLAFWTAGPMTVVSWARMTRTFAPCDSRLSTSVSCCSVLRFASASMNVPPPAVTVSRMFGWSCAAQRGCWKLFHDTPTVQSVAAADPPALGAASLAAALAAGASLAAGTSLCGAVVAPPDVHADATIARVATSNPIRRSIILDSFSSGFRTPR